MYSCRVQCRLYISNMIGRKYCEIFSGIEKENRNRAQFKKQQQQKNNNMPSFPFLSFSNKIKNLKLCSWVKTFEKILNSGLFFMNSQDVCRCLFNVFLVFSSFKSWRQSRSPGLAGTRGGASHSRAGCPGDGGGAWGEGGVKQRETAENLGMEAPPL